MRVVVRDWSAWAPQLETEDAWRAWSARTHAVGSETTAQATFLPAMLRRRCTPLTRIMLTAAFGAVRDHDAAVARTTFASRHGSINESVAMLKNVALGRKLSPSTFTHTVHNAQAALFSLAAENREASSALAAQEETFESGFLESVTHLHREPARPVLFVVGDVPLAPDFAPLIDEPDAAYSVALLLALTGEGTKLDFELSGATAEEADGQHASRIAFDRGWPNALEFLRWLLSNESELRLPGRRRGWV